MDIDAIVAQATAADQATTTETEVVQAAEEQVKPEGTDEPQAAKPEETPFPKKALNAISYRDKKIGKLSAEMQALKAEVEKYRQSQQPQQPKQQDPNAPKADDFESYEDFIAAKTRYEIQQEFANRETKQSKQAEDAELSKWAEDRSTLVDKREEELSQVIPDYAAFSEEMEGLPGLPADKARIALEMDDVLLAAYTLHKEGKLYEVLEMPTSRFAIELAKAEVRGQSYLKPQITKAPAPISAAKGTAPAGKSLNDLKAGEYLKWLKT